MLVSKITRRSQWQESSRADQVDCVEYLDAATLIAARVRQVAVVIVCRQRTDADRVGGSVTDCMQHLHVTDVVNIQRLLQTHHESLRDIITSENKLNAWLLWTLKPSRVLSKKIHTSEKFRYW